MFSVEMGLHFEFFDNFGRYTVNINGGHLEVFKRYWKNTIVNGDIFLRARGVPVSFLGWTCFVGDTLVCPRREGDYVAVGVEMEFSPNEDLDGVVERVVSLATAWLREKVEEVDPPEGWSLEEYVRKERMGFYGEWWSGDVFAIDNNGHLGGFFDNVKVSLPLDEGSMRESMERYPNLSYFLVNVNIGNHVHWLFMVPTSKPRGLEFSVRGEEEALGCEIEEMRNRGEEEEFPAIVHKASLILVEKCRDSLTRDFLNDSLSVFTHDDERRYI